MEIVTFKDTRLDASILFLSGILRNFVYGATFIILIDFIKLKNKDHMTGIIQAIFIVSDALITIYIPLFYNHGRFKLLKILILLKSLTMLAFTFYQNTFTLIILAFTGTISVTGLETGLFKNIQLAGLSKLAKNTRFNIQLNFRYYEILTILAKGCGAFFSGYYINYNQHSDSSDRQYTKERMVQVMLLCSGIVAINFLLYLLVSRQAQPKDPKQPQYPQSIKQLSVKATPYLRIICFFDGLGTGFTTLSIFAFILSNKVYSNYENLSKFFFYVFVVATIIKGLTSSYFKSPISFENRIIFTSILSNGVLFLIAYFLSKAPLLASFFILSCIGLHSIQIQAQDCNAKNILSYHLGGKQGDITSLINKLGMALAFCLSGYLLTKQTMFLSFVIGGMAKMIADVGLLIFSTWSQRIGQQKMIKKLYAQGQLKSLSQKSIENEVQEQ